MYEYIKIMTLQEMQDFIYWVYSNGNSDGKEGCGDSYGFSSYFGGAMLRMNPEEVMREVHKFYSEDE